jgi:predicted Rossmann fold nucleotide-binding protein DprA/Smf involved in DNA uptake
MISTAALSCETAVTLLLCGRFGTTRDGHNVLSPSRFNDLARWIDNHKLSFRDLVKPDVRAILRGYYGEPNEIENTYALLNRTEDLGVALKRWDEMGIWVVGRYDRTYPARLRERLRSAAFPLLFGTGDLSLLDGGGVCIVGSRDSSRQGLDFAKRLATGCGKEGMTVISSDMRGVDRAAVTAALDNHGQVVCVLSDCLEKRIANRRSRAAFDAGKLAMVTPFSPETRFKVANAIRANKYQYALSDVAVVVETRQTGGVWLGADENRNEGWVPAFVHLGKNLAAGNMALLHLGLPPITLQDLDKAKSLRDYFLRNGLSTRAQDSASNGDAAGSRLPADLYSIFLAELRAIGSGRRHRIADVAAMFGIERRQAEAWISRALADGAIEGDDDGLLSVD